MQSRCDVKSGVDPLARKQKRLGFSHILKPIKRQDLLENGKKKKKKKKMAAMRSLQVQRFILAKKIFCG